MKRATLSAYPTNLPSHPADLTDRLLEREGSQSPALLKRQRRRRPEARRSTPEPDSPGNPQEAPAPYPAPSTSLEAALAAADSAAEALQKAGSEAPARYDVALRYRLDALAHHLRQVKEFVASLAAR